MAVQWRAADGSPRVPREPRMNTDAGVVLNDEWTRMRVVFCTTNGHD
ncbi:MAG: hypothetical protein ACK5YO_03080 [Planctomyces sp.]